MCSEESPLEETKKELYQLLVANLPDPWSTVDYNDLIVNVFSNGMVNKVYRCTVSSPIKNGKVNQVSMVVRLKRDETKAFKIVDNVHDTVASLILSSKNLFPKIYAVFESGRIEKFVQGRTMTCKDAEDPKLLTEVAKAVAKIHSLDIPISKEPFYFQKCYESFRIERSTYEDIVQRYASEEIKEALLTFDLNSECDWFLGNLTKIKSKVVFSHNDVTPGNTILEHCSKPLLIDYELCTYNYRGYDLGHFLLFKSLHFPKSAEDKHEYPPEEVRRHFIRSYLKSMTWLPVSKQDEDQLLLEVDYLALFADLQLILKIMKYSENPTEKTTDHMDYVNLRVQVYLKQKAAFIERYKSPEEWP